MRSAVATVVRRRLLAVGAVGAVGVVAVLGLAGCGRDSDRSAVAERQVRSALADRFEDPDAVEVDCPDEVGVEPGTSITCDLTVDGSAPKAATFDVGEDGVLVLTAAVMPTGALEDYLVGELGSAAEGPVTATCGADPLLIGPVGDTFPCSVVRVDDGQAFDVPVEVAAIDGTVTYDVIPVTAGATTTTAVPAG